ncbi:cyclin-dependent kinase 20 isoform X2 [Adelges cooleyi]|uniref:cyclin-dependent kinase 20 isoform X2 n=1 Tax=Adelges cooleyi TaxID=133065 RepID=UPI00217FD5B6|nr:cyclin-dependent kinase 20 isoform X2 [Adelges cooleyi]XP_050420867.1 cyclin-dependent kinase 20 isoform X2 [Adelges cooleyi]
MKIILYRIGEGTHGQVVQALQRSSGKMVALKCVRSVERTPKHVLREIESLKALHSDYIIKILEHFCHSFSFYLVLEYMVSGLSEMLHDETINLNDSHLKSYARMLIRGIQHIHSLNIMHRDLKPANLLISSKGVLKIADFSLSRLLWTDVDNDSVDCCYTRQVATRRYRAPELLFGSIYYNRSIDMWSVGCILAEMYTRTSLFLGDSDMEQIAIVVHYLGTPTDKNWPKRKEMPDYNKLQFIDCNSIPMDSLLPDVDKQLVDLVAKLILYDADKRLNAEEALLHSYFFNEPLPCLEHRMPIPPQNHRQKIIPKQTRVIDNIEQNFSDLYKIIQESF